MNEDNIQQRKLDHLRIPIEHDVQHLENYFDDIKLIHHSLPEVDLEEIDLSVEFFERKLSAPICISAITGGHPTSKAINTILATAAEKEGIMMGVGSQRASLLDPSTEDSFKVICEVAPNIPIIGNIGIGQVADNDFTVSDIERCIEMINADAIAIHFNALHELLQDDGDISYNQFRSNFLKIKDKIKVPIIAKEVGTGMSEELALILDKLGFDGFDIGGTGGTSFAAIESKRKNFDNETYTRNPAEIFREWGIPTPVSVVKVRNASVKPIIASGGIRNGIDIAKSIILGADIGGLAYNFLKSAWKDYQSSTMFNTVNEIRTLKRELRSCLWLMNLANINELKNNTTKRVILGNLYTWLSQ